MRFKEALYAANLPMPNWKFGFQRGVTLQYRPHCEPGAPNERKLPAVHTSQSEFAFSSYFTICALHGFLQYTEGGHPAMHTSQSKFAFSTFHNVMVCSPL